MDLYFTTVSSTDYGAVNEVLIFPPCETQHCVNVSITDDLINEPEERFSLSISFNTSIFINLGPTAGEVVITDDDGKMNSWAIGKG